MSNALAIATVTETLLLVLTDALPSSGVSGAKVTATRPDDRANLPTAGGVNIFLYRVSPNPYLRNADLPTRAADGTPLQRPQVALDLHYLLTFYGEDGTLDQQRLLGSVVRRLYAHPALHHKEILNAQGVAFLAGSNLATQTELIKFTPVNFSLEELSKLWSVFLKTDYVLSVAYTASVVLITTDDLSPGAALPVLKPRLKAVPFSLAVINSVQPQAVTLSSPPGTAQITLSGQNLDAADGVTFLTPGISEAIPGAMVGSNSAQNQLVVQLPEGLRPGVNSVALTRFASPSSPLGASGKVLVQSNAAAFVVEPTVLSLTFSAPQTITAVIAPSVGPSQTVTLVLNQINASPPGTPLAFELAGTPDAAQPDTFDFSTSFTPVGATDAVTVPSGDYLARVRVDAAVSQLEFATPGGFIGPIVTIP